MKAHYEIDHYPNVTTQLYVVSDDGRLLVSDRMTLFEAQQYIRDSYEAHGIVPRLSEHMEAGGIRLMKTQAIEV